MSSIPRLPRQATRARSLAPVLALAVFGAAALLPVAGTGCLASRIVVVDGEGGVGGGAGGDGGGAVTVPGDDPSQNTANVDGITYRALDGHPGCSTVGLETRAAGCPKQGGAYTPAQIPGYKCAAKAYPVNGDDPKKPIVLLFHGNSSAPSDWEAFAGDPSPGGPTPMLADRLVTAGYRVLAIDLRFDLVDDPKANNDTENAAQNFDHGWAVPIAEHFIESVMAAYPDRELSMVGFSLGSTIIRDALRRLHRANKKPFERVKDLVFGAGAHHGVSSFRALCDKNPTMRGRVSCELGDRTAYTPTKFLAPLNGPDGAFETPCLDGKTAFGQTGVCGDHPVRYTTVVMADKPDENGSPAYQDEFVSEASSALKGANNLTVPLGNPDVSKYFCDGLLDDHCGAVRGEAAVTLLMNALTAP